MLTCALQSGSNGNAIYVEAAGVGLLFDAGLSARRVQERLARKGRAAHGVQALILSHAHADHTRGAGVCHRLFGWPVYATPGTYAAIRRQFGPVRGDGVRWFAPGQTLAFGAVRVHTLPTPHDARESVAFIVEAEGRRLGIFTDLGHPFGALARALCEVHAAYLESNYDPHLLDTGPYPPELKARIRGQAGHLSNDEAAALLHRCCPRPSWIALAHLSAENNTPELALAAARQRVGASYPLHVTSRYEVSELWSI